MVTGKPPFTGDDVSAIMFQILNFVPPPPSTVNPDAPEMLDFIVAKALAKSPGDRRITSYNVCYTKLLRCSHHRGP